MPARQDLEKLVSTAAVSEPVMSKAFAFAGSLKSAAVAIAFDRHLQNHVRHASGKELSGGARKAR